MARSSTRSEGARAYSYGPRKFLSTISFCSIGDSPSARAQRATNIDHSPVNGQRKCARHGNDRVQQGAAGERELVRAPIPAASEDAVQISSDSEAGHMRPRFAINCTREVRVTRQPGWVLS
eukprot:3934332-Prymnesium_polylepis.1